MQLGSIVIFVAGISVAASGCAGAGRASDTLAETDGAAATGGTGGRTSSDSANSVGGGFGSPAATTGVGAACAGTTFAAEKVPLDMYIMLDQSGSMNDAVSGGTKWTAVTQALTTFVQEPEAQGIGVGLQYFGLPPGGAACPTQCYFDADCGACGPCVGATATAEGSCYNAAGNSSCNAADYAHPEIEIAPLPGVASAVVASMAVHSPHTGTPTSPALQGAVDHAKAWATMNPGHVVVAVLATDGDPSECDTALADIDAIAAAGAAGAPKIPTFVIGVGPLEASLNGIAAAGGTNQAFLVDTNLNAQDQFLAALNAIQVLALGCSYAIPVPESGEPDYGAVNVEYTPGATTTADTIPKVASAAACPPNGDGWYYDDDTHPTRIILCDSTCTKISSDAMASVDVVVGCASVVN